MAITQNIEKYVPAVRNARSLRTSYPIYAPAVITAGLTGLTNGTLASAATVAFTPTNKLTTHTPTQNETINFATLPAGTSAGTSLFLEIITSGTTSYTLTFGTNTKNQGTLATGTVSGKYFLVEFVWDLTQWVEVSRTTAM